MAGTTSRITKAAHLKQLTQQFIDLEGRLDKVKDEKDVVNIKAQKEGTRSKIAETFVIGYFIILVSVFILTLSYNILISSLRLNLPPLEVKDMILIFTSTIGPTLGIVLGYYFKGQEDK